MNKFTDKQCFDMGMLIALNSLLLERVIEQQDTLFKILNFGALKELHDCKVIYTQINVLLEKVKAILQRGETITEIYKDEPIKFA